MKTIKTILIMSIPVLMLSCNNNPNKNTNSSATTSEGGMMANSSASGKDEEFVKDAASGGLLEVELGRYAAENATDQRVKSFGNMMVRDHTRANEELKALAESKNIKLPATLDDDHFEMISDLQKKKGTDFDKEYMKSMVDDHQEDIDKFKKQAEDGSDPELKAFAAKTVPVLQAHLDSAKNIQKTLK